MTLPFLPFIFLHSCRWLGEDLIGSDAIDDAATSLLKFAETVDTSKSGEPKFLAVVVATGYGYARADGVQVVPLAHLSS